MGACGTLWRQASAPELKMPRHSNTLQIFAPILIGAFASCSAHDRSDRRPVNANAGTSAPAQTLGVAPPQSRPPRMPADTIEGVIIDHAGKPVSGAAVVLAHELDATIIYNSEEIVTAVQRRADQMPGAPRPAGDTTGHTESGAAGRFRVASLAPGPFTLMAVHPSRGVGVVTGLEPGSVPVNVVLDAPSFLTARVGGVAFDPAWTFMSLDAESPWSNIQIGLRLRPTQEGPLRAGPLPSSCRWTLNISQRHQARSFLVPLLSMPVTTSGSPEVTVSYDAGTGSTLTGRVTLPDGTGLADVGVRARPRDASLPARGTFTASDGFFSLEGLAPGSYDLIAVRHTLRSDIGCGEGPVDVRASQEVRMSEAGAITADIRVDRVLKTLQVGDMAPDFAGTTVDGSAVSLATLKGKVVLIDFWATWCAICLADMKHLAKVHEEFAPSGQFAVIGVAMDADPRAVERFLKRQRMPWPQLVLGPAGVNPIATLYNINSTPNVFLVGKDGRIVAKNMGGENLRDAVVRALETDRKDAQ